VRQQQRTEEDKTQVMSNAKKERDALKAAEKEADTKMNHELSELEARSKTLAKSADEKNMEAAKIFATVSDHSTSGQEQLEVWKRSYAKQVELADTELEKGKKSLEEEYRTEMEKISIQKNNALASLGNRPSGIDKDGVLANEQRNLANSRKQAKAIEEDRVNRATKERDSQIAELDKAAKKTKSLVNQEEAESMKELNQKMEAADAQFDEKQAQAEENEATGTEDVKGAKQMALDVAKHEAQQLLEQSKQKLQKEMQDAKAIFMAQVDASTAKFVKAVAKTKMEVVPKAMVKNGP